MRVSVIAAIYKDIQALQLIIDALNNQTYKNIELVVAEDNNSPEVAEYLKTVSGIDILHTTQEDIGIRKARSQNNAILKSTGDYLIFIDGDCIPYSNFISSHVALSEKGCLLSGRRVNLGSRISQLFRKGSFKASTLARYYLWFIPALWADHATHVTQGFSFCPEGWIYKQFIAKRKKSNTNILGCNFSCFKIDMIKVDGFDESYGETSVPDDTDIQWRLEVTGLRVKSCKQAANVFHLYHTPRTKAFDSESMIAKMHRRKANGDFAAERGLPSHLEGN